MACEEVTRVGSTNDWAAVANDFTVTVGLHRDGSLWAWRDNGFGQLGLGYTTDRWIPTQLASGGP
jgi:alpha-tubulin suppressor-like RCC1 family protein